MRLTNSTELEYHESFFIRNLLQIQRRDYVNLTARKTDTISKNILQLIESTSCLIQKGYKSWI